MICCSNFVLTGVQTFITVKVSERVAADLTALSSRKVKSRTFVQPGSSSSFVFERIALYYEKALRGNYSLFLVLEVFI